MHRRVTLLLALAAVRSIAAFAPSPYANHKSFKLRLSDVDIPKNELPYGEESRRYRRTYYGEDDWIKHRANDRFLGNLRKIFRSGIVRSLATEIGTVAGLGLAICIYNALLVSGYQDFAGNMHDPLDLPWTPPLASLPVEPFSLSSPALGLLLVFRTNASYARWSEARARWSSVVSHSRNIVRLGAGWMPQELDEDEKRQLLENLANNAWAFARSLQRHLLGRREDDECYCREVKERLPQEVAQSLIEAEHKPNRALYELTKAVNAIPMSEHRHVEIDRGVEHLCDALGGCERIYNSPVPLVYTRHTARFLGFWILALPMALFESFGTSWNHIGLLPAAILISFFFFGIEELAIQLEEPFTILPLKQLVDGIGVSVDDTVEWFIEDEKTTRQKELITSLHGEREPVGVHNKLLSKFRS